MIVWTRAYRPFMMGGDVHAPIGIDLNPGERQDLGKGFYGYVIVSPVTSKIHIAEEQSGAFIGSSLKQVRNDIESCEDIEFMKQQVKDAIKTREKVDILNKDKFWELVSRAK